MNNKVVYLPLDERPCNYKFPKLLPKTNLNIINPSKDILGDKKIAANFEKIRNFLIDSTKDSDYLVLSIDMLLYGGIVPSRLHNLSYSTLEERLRVLKVIKKNNPKIKIYAFGLIMRCPQYSSNDEEPDYYENYGESIFNYGVLKHKKSLGIISDDELSCLNDLERNIPKEIILDFENRRDINKSLLLTTLRLYKEKIIDVFIIPQDDSAPYGYTALDKVSIKKEINSLNVNVLNYPGADEVGLVLLARVLNDVLNVKPKIYPFYASKFGSQVIPLYEDRIIDLTVSSQIEAVNGIRVDDICHADFVLAINIGSGMVDYFEEDCELYYKTNRNLDEFVDKIFKYISDGKKVMLADVAYANKGDLKLIKKLDSKNILFNLMGYGGWNTSSNSIGTAIASAIFAVNSIDHESIKKFLAYRYIEDVIYMGIVRLQVTARLKEYGMNYFYVKEEKGLASKLIEDELNKYINDNFKKSLSSYKINIKLPWRRMFEIDLDLE